MKPLKFLVPMFFAAAACLSPAMAEQNKVCIDANMSYNARAIGNHEVMIRSSVGHDRPSLRLATTCLDLAPTTVGVSVSSEFRCVGLGDTVVAANIDGRQETCRITHVTPYVHTDGDFHS